MLLALTTLLVGAPIAVAPRLPSEPAGEDAEVYRVSSRGYGPVGRVLYRRPRFGWAVAPLNGAKVTGATMTLNSAALPVVYDAARAELVYTPPAPLSPGKYEVAVALRVNDAVTFRKTWTTIVPVEAAESLPAPRREQVAVFDALNSLRDGMRLPRYTLDPTLNAAADSQARYLETNETRGHQQEPGRPGFVGEMPWDRAQAFGFSGSTWEAAGYQVADPKAAMQAIFDAPYHRIPFMHPAASKVGVGVSAMGTIVDGESAAGSGSVVSPGPDATDVPRQWIGYERPDPLRRFADLQRPVGYPVVFAVFGAEGKLTGVKARLLRGSEEVPAIVNAPENDSELTNAAMLIPREPLAPRTVYSVEFAATADGRPVGRSWNFKTGP